MPQEYGLIWAAVSSKKQDRYSVDDQLAFAREWCRANNVAVVDELVVRGFSRDYWTLDDVVKAAEVDADMEAFARLQRHIRQKDFTLFWCFDADRFGRTPSLVHEVIGRVAYDCKARVFTYFDHTWIDSQNALMVGTLKALTARQGVEKLQQYFQTGMTNRAIAGKSTTPVIPLFHKSLRDSFGKEYALVVNEDLRPLWTDLARVLLEGVVWEKMELVLFERYGHGRDGKPYPRYTMRSYLFNPSFWGHVMRGKRGKHDKRSNYYGAWRWDESVPPPDGIQVYYSRRPAVYAGQWAELGEEVKRELWRRYRLKGKATAQNSYRFHGLLVCDECGYSLNRMHSSVNDHVYMRCETHWRQTARGGDCANRKYIHADRVQAYCNGQIRDQLAGLPSEMFSNVTNVTYIEQSIRDEEAKIVTAERQLQTLVSGYASAPIPALPTFQREIDNVAAELARAQHSLTVWQRQMVEVRSVHSSQQETLAHLRAVGVDWLWQQTDTVIHQHLSSILVDHQLVVRDGEIIGVAPTRNKALATRLRRKKER